MSTILKNFHLKEDLIEELENISQIEDRSKSAVVRRALKEYFMRSKNERRKKRPKR